MNESSKDKREENEIMKLNCLTFSNDQWTDEWITSYKNDDDDGVDDVGGDEYQIVISISSLFFLCSTIEARPMNNVKVHYENDIYLKNETISMSVTRGSQRCRDIVQIESKRKSQRKENPLVSKSRIR